MSQSYQEIQSEIQKLTSQLQDLRRIERNLQIREQALSSQPQVPARDLRAHLGSFLPEKLMPRNVGPINSVAWPFYFQVDFDFGTNPALTSVLTQTQNFQVTQDAGLLLLQISKTADAYSTAGALGPWNVIARDRQSSRQFNDIPMPLQMIGSRGRPSFLPTPMLLMPNAFLDVTMSTWLPAGFTQNTVGDGKIQISFHGLRIRIEDYDKVLSSVFA